MIDWAARARTHFSQPHGGGTAETDETGVVSVSSVHGTGIGCHPAGLSSVSSVGVSALSANEVSAVGTVVVVRRASGNPYMTPEQADACHEAGWDDAEIEAFMARSTLLSARGRADAEHLAERLTLRYRDGDDRRLCLECTWLGDTGRCLAAATGRIPGADRRLEPVQSILQRCEAFGIREGLT